MTRIALVQHRVTTDRMANVEQGVKALGAAARAGAQLVCYAELYGSWLARDSGRPPP